MHKSHTALAFQGSNHKAIHPPLEEGFLPRNHTQYNLGELINWLSQKQIELLEYANLPAPGSWWEPFLSDLNAFQDRNTFQLFRATTAFGEFRAFFTRAFWLYAHARDMLRSGPMLESYRNAQGMDQLSQDLNQFLNAEASLIETHHNMPGSFLNIGCGGCPETLLYYGKRLKEWNIAAMDLDGDAVQCARKACKVLGHHQTEVIHHNGSTFNYQPYSVIHVANYVSPKRKVLDTIAETAFRGTLVLMRTPKMLEELICDAIDARDLPFYHEVGRVESHYCQMDSVLLKLDY